MKFQSNEKQQHLLIEGPQMGDWFAVAFISWTDPRKDRIEQQGRSILYFLVFSKQTINFLLRIVLNSNTNYHFYLSPHKP